MNVYVASSSHNRVAVRELYALLLAAGHRVEYDWTAHSIEGMTNQQEIDAKLAAIAEADRSGVVKCNALILLAHPDACATYTEFGIALAMYKRIVVVDAEAGRFNIFYSLGNIFHVKTMAEAVAMLGAPIPPPTDAELHSRMLHPDFDYEITEGQRKNWDDSEVPPEGDGWVRNTYRGSNGWERFDFTEESYWMRPKVRPAPLSI